MFSGSKSNHFGSQRLSGKLPGTGEEPGTVPGGPGRVSGRADVPESEESYGFLRSGSRAGGRGAGAGGSPRVPD